MSIFRRSYTIPVDRDDWVAPEDTLMDVGSSHADMEAPVSGSLFRIVGAVCAVAGLIIAGTGYRLAIAQQETWEVASVRNRTVNVAVPPPRGVIMDRSGQVLVENVPSFDVLAISRQVDLSAAGADTALRRIADILGSPGDAFVQNIREQVARSAVFFVATDVPKEQILSLRSALVPGLYLVTNTKRHYVDGPQFSSIIGYVGKVGKNDLARDPYYLPTDGIGRLGVEAWYEEALRGTHGRIQFVSTGEDATQDNPTPGKTVVLTVDASAQKHLFSDVMNVVRGTNLSGAAAVVQDVRTGGVIGMVSVPGYDNNIFSGDVSRKEYALLFSNTSRPLFNRVIAGLYNPGSTIKPFIGMAALNEGVVQPGDTVQDCISISIPNPSDPSDPYVFKNWRPETGAFNLRRAIANSCNVYFFAAGGGWGPFSGLGVQRIVSYLQKASANMILGVDLVGEDNGFIPTPDWKRATTGEPWYQGDTFNISIGQGDLLVTPLWINAYIGAIANGGTLWRPHVAQKILNADASVTETIEPERVAVLPFAPDVITEMSRDMQETVRTGTAKMLQSVGVSVSAKTGTAEVIKGRRINSLVTLFAPAENPEIAMTVLIEGSSSNEGYALRVAQAFLKWYFQRGAPTPEPVPTPDATPSPEPTAAQ